MSMLSKKRVFSLSSGFVEKANRSFIEKRTSEFYSDKTLTLKSRAVLDRFSISEEQMTSAFEKALSKINTKA